jgi:V/A-type H+-transporting ATPase subunit I
MITKMTRVRIYGPKESMDGVTNILYDMGVLHLEQLPPSIVSRVAVQERMHEDKESVRGKVELEGLLEKVRRPLILLPRPKEVRPDHFTGDLASEIEKGEMPKVVEDIYRQVESLSAKRKEIADQIELLGKYEKMIRSILPMVESLPDTQHLEMVGLTLDKKSEGVLEILEKELSRITGGNLHVYSADIDENTVAAMLLFGKSYAPRIKELLWEQNVSELKLPSHLENLPLKEALSQVSLQSGDLPKELKVVEGQLATLATQWYSYLSGLAEAINGRLQQLSTSSSFFRTRFSFVVAGWLPKRSFPELVTKLESTFGGTVVTEEIPITHADEKSIPIHMSNPPLIKPFEVFIKLLPLPIYNTIDPTPFFAFFFPIFFGLIVGDIGYGLIFLAISLFFRRKVEKGGKLHDIFTVLIYSSVYAVVFGVVFGEFLGTLGEHWGLHPWKIGGVKLDRVKEIPFFLGLSVVVGCIHVFLGIILGMVNAIRTQHRKHLIYRVGQFLALVGLIVLLVVLSGKIDRAFMWPTVLILLGGLALWIMAEGPIATIELLSAMGNILSYARIMAVGLSGVILALVANKMGEMSAVGILMALLLHLINIVLGMFSPTLHSMRLHLVEFFTKFYETGGAEYKPFKRQGGR